MPLTKQAVNVNFSQGLDTKTDPYQVQAGKFLGLQNTIFIKGGLLQKRNGFGPLPSLPGPASIVTTFNGDLTAIGNQLFALSAGYGQWVSRGNVNPLVLTTLPLIRNNTNQSQADIAISASGLICTVYTDQNPANLSVNVYKYAVADVSTGQNIIQPTLITNADPQFGTPRVFLLGSYFIIAYTSKVVSTYHIQYIAVSTVNPNNVSAPVDVTISYTPASTVSWDAAVLNNSLYFAWNGGSSSGIKMTFLTSHLSLGAAFNPDPAHSATIMSVTADAFNNIIWASYYNLGTTTGYTLAESPQLAPILAPTEIISSGTILNLTSVASHGTLSFFYEVSNNYSYDSSIPTHFTLSNTCTQSGTVGTPVTLLRSVGLASKAFFIDSTIYMLVEYQSPYQNTYFLTDSLGNIIAKLAYGNGGGYLTTGLPNAIVNGSEVQIPYLIKDTVTAVNKNTNVPAGNQVAGIYSQTGINLVSFTLETTDIITAEIGANLNITGGFLWAYDGYSSVEQEFFLYPDSIEATWSTTGGAIHAQPDGSTNTDAYFYQVTYEWSDNQGNNFRSAPSIPIAVTTTGSGTTGSITISGPILRLTYKTANPVKIVIYRWSVAQESYYQVTSILLPLLNNETGNLDSFTFTDTLSDAAILGDNLLYTTGGVLENIGPPSFLSTFIFDDRLWGIVSEDPNLLWFSKQVLEATPVEFTDLQTIYVAPNVGAQGPTGSLKCGASMDDKLILFKASAINYINGTGPDATGANSQYSQPIFITATVGSSNQHSIVFQPQGLMFEFASPAGNQIWLLGRDLSTQYIGAPVEKLTTNATVLASVNEPGTNQVTFWMSSGITLMYDYYYGQWGTFVNIPSVSSTLYQGLRTYINSFGQVFQETPGLYLDGSNPVLMNFTTSWLNFAGLQGYERAYLFYLLGTYSTPHKLVLSIAYDYNSNATQMSTINPSNFAPAYGDDLTYGSGTPYGGPGNIERWRIFLARQRCQAFQVNLSEIYDPSYGVAAGSGLTISGLDFVVGIKKGYAPIRADHSVG